ncbi:response regulator transcription factor [Candidatus Galacturonibacter soehngenii]|uniref:Stage 0 sporulation protein A homolog n=1 Tax=Candidatus Galacturonatibacter soehngenii TaxID=2307010 RepID=A0A7V7QKN6_9FIRM|nr:response regulator transcription factor [Candidatus Galacturonibacter soehngenii]KAB1438400.1 response regulator transcription factor [Candidatus Galacturonibacter soehngenii]
MINILIVEDEKNISDLIKINLMEAGYHCVCAYDGKQAADLIEQNNWDLILLDIMLPKINGYELIEYIKPLDISVIFITAKASVTDIVKGLKLGADDYLTKPFEIIELLARVESVLRRDKKNNRILEVADISIDTFSRLVKRGEDTITLTLKEYELLLLFIRSKNIALFREQIYEKIWGDDYMGDSRTVDLHVQRLRKKMGWEKYITAVYKIGYRFEVKP